LAIDIRRAMATHVLVKMDFDRHLPMPTSKAGLSDRKLYGERNMSVQSEKAAQRSPESFSLLERFNQHLTSFAGSKFAVDAFNGEPITAEAIRAVEGLPEYYNPAVMLSLSSAPFPLGLLLDRGVLSPALAYRALGLPEENLEEIASKLGLDEFDPRGRDFWPGEVVEVDEVVLDALIEDAL
jgi:hypothetical protein